MQTRGILSLAAVLLTTAITAIAEPVVVNVDGFGQVDATPDGILIHLGTEKDADTAKEAYDEVAATMTRVIAALKDAGLDEPNLQTTRIELDQTFRTEEINGVRRRLPDRFRAGYELKVRIADASQAPNVIDVAVKAGADRLWGMSFDISDRQSLSDRALAMAVQDTRRKAEIMAIAAGGALGRMVSLTEGAYGNSQTEIELESGPDLMPIESRAVSIEAYVQARYEIVFDDNQMKAE